MSSPRAPAFYAFLPAWHRTMRADPRDVRIDAEEAPDVPVLRPQLPTLARLTPYLSRIDQSRCYTNWGPLATELERRLASRFGLPAHGVVSAASGTTALVGAILGSAGRARPERPLALVPAFTFVATALAIELCGYRLHVVDVDERDWVIHAGTMEAHRLLARVGLVVPVAAYGRPVLQKEWDRFHHATGIPVVIDAAAAFEGLDCEPSSWVGEVPVTLSFHATKAFACGEGGCVVTTDAERARSVTRALNFGFFDDRECRGASTNGKLSEYHAAVGLAELDGWHEKRDAWRMVAAIYRDEARRAGLGDRIVLAPTVAGCYALSVANDGREFASVRRSLRARRIETRAWYAGGVHRHPRFEDVSRDPLPVTDALAPLVLGLPVAPDLEGAAIRRVIDAVREGVAGPA